MEQAKDNTETSASKNSQSLIPTCEPEMKSTNMIKDSDLFLTSENSVDSNFNQKKAKKQKSISVQYKPYLAKEKSATSKIEGDFASNSSFPSFKLNTSYLDRFITSAVVSSELIRMRVYFTLF